VHISNILQSSFAAWGSNYFGGFTMEADVLPPMPHSQYWFAAWSLCEEAKKWRLCSSWEGSIPPAGVWIHVPNPHACLC
jgi:hypothetical protein